MNKRDAQYTLMMLAVKGMEAQEDTVRKMKEKPVNTLTEGSAGMKIYISGPVTGTKGYMERFAWAEEALRAEGYTVVNPVKVNAQLPEGTAHSEYMKMSIDMLEMCSGIFMLDGWQESTGCNMEFEYAYEHKHTIMFEGGRG